MTLTERLKAIFKSVDEVETAAVGLLPPVPDEWLCSGTAPDEWDAFFDPTLLRAWSGELQHCLECKDTAMWALAGPAILVQHADEEEAASMLWRSALSAGFTFARVPVDDVESLAADPRVRFMSHAPVLVMLESGDWAQGKVGEVDAMELAPYNNRFTAALRKQFDLAPGVRIS